jgi:hypothetical protein
MQQYFRPRRELSHESQQVVQMRLERFAAPAFAADLLERDEIPRLIRQRLLEIRPMRLAVAAPSVVRFMVRLPASIDGEVPVLLQRTAAQVRSADLKGRLAAGGGNAIKTTQCILGETVADRQ